MSNLCECCGKRNNPFAGNPLRLPNDKILCHKCAEPIALDLNYLLYAAKPDEFHELRSKILNKCKSHFDSNITTEIEALIYNRGKRLNINFTDEYVKTISHILASAETSSDSGMFSNIGGKIMNLARFITFLGIMASIIIGVIICAEDSDMTPLGLLIMIIGPLLSWLSSFLLYGFGQLIDNSQQILNELRK